MKFESLSDGGTVWVVPAARYKSKRDTLIPLSKAAQQIIAGQPVRGPYVFGVDGSRPLGGFNDRKKNLDARSGVSGYGLHDLRRSARTLLSRAGVAADIAEMCLGHAFVASAAFTIDSNTSTKSVKRSRRWRRWSSAS